MIGLSEFRGFKCSQSGYNYPVVRQRKDGVVRVIGFANCRPPAWSFLVHAVLRNERVHAIRDVGGKTEHVELVHPTPYNDKHPKRRLTKEGRSLLFALMPSDVHDAVLIFVEVRP